MTTTEYECAQCQCTLSLPPLSISQLWEDEDGRIFCSLRCCEAYDERQGELQLEMKLS